MIKTIGILLFVHLLFCCEITGQQVFDTTLFLNSLNNTFEGSTDIDYTNGKFYLCGRFANYENGFRDSSYLAIVDRYGRIEHSHTIGNGLLERSYYGVDIHKYQDYVITLYSEVDNSIQDGFDPLLNIYNEESNYWFNVVPSIDTLNYEARASIITENHLFILGATADYFQNETNKALIAKFDLNIEEWQDTIQAIDYLLIDGNEHDHKLMEGAILSDGSILAIMHEYSPGYLAAMSLCKINQDLSLLWKKNYTDVGFNNYGHVSESYNDPQHFFISGSINTQRMISKFDFDGNIIWQKKHPIENEDFSYFRGVFEDEDGNLLGGGKLSPIYLNEPLQAFLSKFNSDGELLWDRFYPAPLNNEAYVYDMEQTLDGGYAMCGSIHFPAPRRSDIWLIKIDSLGNVDLPLGIFTELNEYWIPQGDSLLLNPVPYGGNGIYSYLNPTWSGNTVNFTQTEEFGGIFYGYEKGDYELSFSITDTLGASAQVNYIIHVYDPTSNTTAINKNQWKTYPNPASDIIHFDNNNLNQQATHIQVFDIAGREYANFKAQNQSSLDVSIWQNGVYVYHIFNGEKLLFEGRFLVWHA